MIYEEFDFKYDEEDSEFIDANKLSYLFGLNYVDLKKPITVFEGPLDAFLFDNGMSTCGLKNKFPLDIPVRWMDDFDKDGITKTLERLKNKETVFLWEKFLKDMKINTFGKKFDLTDLMKYIKQKQIKVLNFEKYFSNSKYDIYLL